MYFTISLQDAWILSVVTFLRIKIRLGTWWEFKFDEKKCSTAQKFVPNDLVITSTKTKFIIPNTKTQNIFCRLNENLMSFLYTLTGVTRKQKEK